MEENNQPQVLFFSYIEQDDSFIATLTCRETVRSYALLSLPSSMPHHVKNMLADQALDDLGLTHIASSRVGDTLKRGISTGERRRLSIACRVGGWVNIAVY